MTQTQTAYLSMLEQRRHNRATEANEAAKIKIEQEYLPYRKQQATADATAKGVGAGTAILGAITGAAVKSVSQKAVASSELTTTAQKAVDAASNSALAHVAITASAPKITGMLTAEEFNWANDVLKKNGEPALDMKVGMNLSGMGQKRQDALKELHTAVKSRDEAAVLAWAKQHPEFQTKFR